MAHVIPCKKKIDVVQVVDIFFREIVRLHGLPKSIIFDRDISLLVIFGELCGRIWVLN